MNQKQDKDLDFGSLLDRHTPKFKPSFSPGQKLSGVVTAVDENGVFVDIGSRSEGILSREEVLDKEGQITVEEGETIEVYFLGERNGEVRLTTRIGGSDADESSILDAWESQIPIEGKVSGETNGGYEVEIGSHRGFCPYSQIDVRHQEAAAYIGEKYRFVITECNDSLRNLVLSRRQLLEMEQARIREELKETLKPGMILEGTVSRLMDFGAFIDIGGGVDGLVHVSELAWGRNIKPEDVVSPGDQVSVMVRSLDWEKGRISLSLRYAQANPWETVEQNYPIGSEVTGTVIKLMPFGAFVELEPGVDGLLHISKLGGGRRINHPQEVLQEQEKVKVQIEAIDVDAQKISLNMSSGDPTEEIDKVQEERMKKGGRDTGSGSFGSLGDMFDKLS